MPVKESSATALVRFTGLGIICFNKERQRGEIAAVRDNNHSLGIKLQRPVFQEGGGNDVLVYQDVAVYRQLPKEGVELEIKAFGNPSIEGYEIYQSGDFDRLDASDPNDFRWLVNMNALHGEQDLSIPREQRYPITKIYLGNGLFYTHRLDTNLFFEKIERDESGVEKQREVFGNVGETVGVVIDGDEVAFTIRIGERKESHRLKRVEGLPFRIEINNMDYSDGAVYSDMADYYKYVSSPHGSHFDFNPIQETGDEPTGGSINQKTYCHPVYVAGLSSIDELSA